MVVSANLTPVVNSLKTIRWFSNQLVKSGHEDLLRLIERVGLDAFHQRVSSTFANWN